VSEHTADVVVVGVGSAGAVAVRVLLLEAAGLDDEPATSATSGSTNASSIMTGERAAELLRAHA
jgi:choline dehydrogenase-like flavoprotein